MRNEIAAVPSIPLIVASILSKKIAEGIDRLVMDVKWGLGAFMKTQEEAKHLASSLAQVGAHAGLHIRTVLTQTDEALGCAVGNALEVEESIACLKGEGPKDVRELVCLLSGDERAAQVLSSGAAYEVFAQMVHAQGGDLNQPLRGGGTKEWTFCSPKEGILRRSDAYNIGCLLYTSPSPRDATLSRMPSSA